MIGSFAVGKTSLVSRFVHNTFSEKYLSTVGVKIDRKVVRQADQDINLMLWDLHGDDAFQRVRMSYVKGAHAYILVIDGTRRATFDTAIQLHGQIREAHGDLPFIVALNKADQEAEWEIDNKTLTELEADGWNLVRTSAKDALGVENLFQQITDSIMGNTP